MRGDDINAYFDGSVAIDVKEQKCYPEIVLDDVVKYEKCDAKLRVKGNVRLFTNVAPRTLIGDTNCNASPLGRMFYEDEVVVSPTAYYYITGMPYSAEHNDSDFKSLFDTQTKCAAAAAWATVNTKTHGNELLANHHVAHYALDTEANVDVLNTMSPGLRSLRVATTMAITMVTPSLDSPNLMFLTHISMCAATIQINDGALSSLPVLAHVILRALESGTLGDKTFCKCPALQTVQLFGNNWTIDKLGTAARVNDTVIAAWYNNAPRVNIPYTQITNQRLNTEIEQATTICATGAVYMSKWLANVFERPGNTQTLILNNIEIASTNETTTVSLEIDLVHRQAKTDIATLVLSRRSSKQLSAAVDIVATEHATDIVHNFTNDATAAVAMAALCNGAINLRTFRVVPVVS